MILRGRKEFKPGDVISTARGSRFFLGVYHVPGEGWHYIWLVEGKKKDVVHSFSPKKYFTVMMRASTTDFISLAK